jgi:hypothetical protein
MSKPSFKLNGESVGYLLHGQAISIDFVIPDVWFVLIHTKKTKMLFNSIKTAFNTLSFKRNKSSYSFNTNAYAPKITFIGIGMNGIYSKTINLQVNFLNTIPHFVRTQNSSVNPIKKALHISKTKLNLLHYMPNITSAEMKINNIQNLQIKLDLSNLNYELSRQSN